MVEWSAVSSCNLVWVPSSLGGCQLCECEAGLAVLVMPLFAGAKPVATQAGLLLGRRAWAEEIEASGFSCDPFVVRRGLGLSQLLGRLRWLAAFLGGVRGVEG